MLIAFAHAECVASYSIATMKHTLKTMMRTVFLNGLLEMLG